MTDGYRLARDVDLTTRNTFGVPARAPVLVEVDDAAALPRLFADGIVDAADPALLVLGGGSNLLFAGDAPGPVLALTAQNVETGDGGDDIVLVRASAGVPWHGFVMHTLSLGLCGLENLALIPGTVGAAPIQNIGAYGVEVRERVHAVEVFERATGKVRRLAPEECGFAYRDSAFKCDPRRWIVTAVEFALSRRPAPMLDYAGLRDELAAMDVATPTAAQVAGAVIRIRRRKLPDPAVLGNAGSFFKNPIVPASQAETLGAANPRLPVFPVAALPADAATHGEADGDATRKLSAAWLIDACGWKGHRDGDAGVSPDHALVLVNHGAATGSQLLALARRITASVHERFGVTLEPEPRIIGADW
ncbi:UDP-N-acetylmuramate dehydrogenase [Luteimonas soli]|uniref:UDP-N-acetylenolpyruvoylglucosamine reductase n=1 Tax=Luteimonas soli TaxID=1648966 RepID=A0ABV7XK86_9GAMM